jgi:hypothetical protein
MALGNLKFQRIISQLFLISFPRKESTTDSKGIETEPNERFNPNRKRRSPERAVNKNLFLVLNEYNGYFKNPKISGLSY